MSNKKSTKRSLIFSVVALLLCMTMFVGTTFAWFTDSVTSGKNQIVAGNLDVAFEYYTENGWEDVEGKTDLVDPEALWEPGHAEVVYLKVTNAGTLALKYQLALTIFNQVQGMTKDGKVIKLAEHLRYGVLNDVEPEAFETREEALEAVEKDLLGARKLADHSEVASLLAGESDTFALVIWMPTTVGNEANHNGVHVPSVELGVSVVATQFTHEEDGFDRYFDRDAFKPIANLEDAGLDKVNALVNMDLNAAAAEIGLDVAYAFLPTETYEETMKSAYKDWHADFVITVDKDVKADEAYLAGYYSAWCDELIDGSWMALSGDLAANEPIRLVQGLGASVSYWEICQYAMDPANNIMGFLCGAGDVDDALAGATLTVELRLYEVTKHPDATSGTANDETGKYITIGTHTHTFSKTVDTAEELKAALTNGGKVELTEDMVVNSSLTVPANTEVYLDLNGHTISGAFNNSGSSALLANKGTLTIANGAMVSLAEYPDVDWGTEGFPTYATNTISNSGTLIIEKGTIIENQTNVGGASYAIDNYAGASLTINGGTILAKDVAIRMNSASATAENKVVINDGIISGKRAIWIHLAGSKDTVAPKMTLVINGGDFNSTSDWTIYSYSYGNSFANTNVEIKGGDFEKIVAFGGGYKGDQETVTVTGGVFHSDLGRYLANDGWVDIEKPL
ncbi:MAG: hypothetical protein IJY50_07675 [Clostridia bacterium]|nr:hypothetical protein [Clostridia bacterium]